MLTTPCKAATVDMFLNQVWINQSDIVLIGLRDYQVCAIDCLNASVWNPIVVTVIVHFLKSLIPGRQGWRHPEVLRWRGQEFEVLWRVPRVCQDQRDRRVRRGGRRWYWVRWCRLWRLWWWLRRWYWWNLIHPVKMSSIWFGWLLELATSHSNASQ